MTKKTMRDLQLEFMINTTSFLIMQAKYLALSLEVGAGMMNTKKREGVEKCAGAVHNLAYEMQNFVNEVAVLKEEV